MDLQIFSNNGWEIRTIEKDGEPWFVGKDVCSILGTETRDIPKILDNDEKDVVDISDTIGRKQKMTIISESGLYFLVLRSRKQDAKRFRKWVTSEVLPSIRKNGMYATPITIENILENPDYGIELLQKLKFERQEKELMKNQRDEAIKTKAYISSKKAATAMQTASVAVRKVNSLENKLGVGKNYNAVSAIKWLDDYFAVSKGLYTTIGKKLSSMSKEMEYKTDTVPHSTYGTVKSYHMDVIKELKKRIESDDNMLDKYRKV